MRSDRQQAQTTHSTQFRAIGAADAHRISSISIVATAREPLPQPRHIEKRSERNIRFKQ